MVPNTAHILQLTLSELWSRPYTMKLQIRMFGLQYSAESICAAIGDISTIQYALYCKLGAKYSAHPPVYALWPVVPAIYNEMTTPHIESAIFNWTYLSCYWRYVINSRSDVLQSWCQIQRTFSGLCYVYSGPGHIQCNYSYVYSGFNIQLNLPALLVETCRHLDARYTANLVAYIAHILQFTLCQLWSRTYTM
jgi:hypothetical protein